MPVAYINITTYIQLRQWNNYWKINTSNIASEYINAITTTSTVPMMKAYVNVYNTGQYSTIMGLIKYEVLN